MICELNKLTLNNEIVSMRHDVRKARVRLVHKITRSIKNLRKGKGSQVPPEKDLVKADKLVEEIRTLKALEDDFITKTLLVYGEDPDKVLSDIRKTLQERVLAKMFTNKIMETTIHKFRTKYPNWHEDVPVLLRNMKKKSNKKVNSLKKSSSNGGNNTKSINIADETEAKEKKFSKIDNHNTKNCTTMNTSSGSWSVSESIRKSKLEKKHVENAGSLKSNTISKQDKGNHSSRTKNDSNGGEFPNNSKISRKMDDDIDEIIPNKTFKLKSKAKCELVEENLLDKGKINKKKSDNIVKDREEIKVADPFFMTSDDNAYLTVVSSKEQAEALQNPSLRNSSLNVDDVMDDDDGNLRGSSNRRFNQMNKYNKKSSFINVGRRSEAFSSEEKDNFNYRNRDFGAFSDRGKDFKGVKNGFEQLPRRERRKLMNSSAIEPSKETEEKLHPSWEAKRRQSCPAIPQFSGKKIIFDD